ncbi:MAG: hypothetical protein OK452_09600 [Thaumarchaeota archaeon]|nr:hypothetical protein [Nitrososphaerota archaeon]
MPRIPGPHGQDADMIKAIESVGPRNVALISRMTGVYKETVRYKVKKLLPNQGFVYHPEVDYGKLGLDLYWGTFHLSPKHGVEATRFFDVLGKSGYLVEYSKVVPQNRFDALFSLPQGRVAEFRLFLGRLLKRRMVLGFSLDEVTACRNRAMGSSSFDFRRGRWDVDWRKVRASQPIPLQVEQESHPFTMLDHFDLMLVSELQRDPLQHVFGIGRKHGVDVKALTYHHRAHVVKNGLIPRHSVRWVRVPAQTVPVRVTFRRLEKDEHGRVQAAASRLPFLRSEHLLKGGTYAATLDVPLADLAETNVYLGQEGGYLGSKVEIGYLTGGRSNIPVPWEEFADGRWELDAKSLEGEVVGNLRRPSNRWRRKGR